MLIPKDSFKFSKIVFNCSIKENFYVVKKSSVFTICKSKILDFTFLSLEQQLIINYI